MKIRELIEIIAKEFETKLYQLGNSFLNLELEFVCKIFIVVLVIGLLKSLWNQFKEPIK